MRVTCQTFWLQKDGLEAEEYEDAFAPKETTDQQLETFRCAVADGATETSFSALWAQLLVDAYVKSETDLTSRQETWKKHVSSLKLSWYAEEKAQSGAFAALVGLTLNSAPPGHRQPGSWEAWAVGDSCLFHVRNDQILKALPLEHWEQFNSSPALLSSYAEQNKAIADKIVTTTGTWNSGDLFYLMSDAISGWFLRRQEEHSDAIKLVSAIHDQDSFVALVSEQRPLVDSTGHHLMRNDDVTLMRVRPVAAVLKQQA